jgi:signal peptidase II
VPLGQGYGSLMEGRVVDMFYFPIISTEWPQWVPLVGGDHFTFFSPIFNFADAAITTGGALLVICYYKTLNQLLTRKKTDID